MEWNKLEESHVNTNWFLSAAFPSQYFTTEFKVVCTEIFKYSQSPPQTSLPNGSVLPLNFGDIFNFFNSFKLISNQSLIEIPFL